MIKWVAQAKKAMDDAEAYGAHKVSEMQPKEKEALLQAFQALGVPYKEA